MNLRGKLLEFMNSFIGVTVLSFSIGAFFGIITGILGMDIHVAFILIYVSMIVFSYYVEGMGLNFFARVLGISAFYLLMLLLTHNAR